MAAQERIWTWLMRGALSDFCLLVTDGKGVVATTAVTVTIDDKMAIAAGKTHEGCLSLHLPARGRDCGRQQGSRQ